MASGRGNNKGFPLRKQSPLDPSSNKNFSGYPDPTRDNRFAMNVPNVGLNNAIRDYSNPLMSNNQFRDNNIDFSGAYGDNQFKPSQKLQSDESFSFTELKSHVESFAKPEKSFNQMQSRGKFLDNLPVSLKQHLGYLTDQGENFFCHVCDVTIKSASENNVVHHLKTKAHEDNILLQLKAKLPNHLQSMVEFISFYGSNLSCNLCRAKIDMSSHNVYETIFNIVSHNNEPRHFTKTSSADSRTQSSALVLDSLADENPLINENKHLIDVKLEPHLKCRLCDKTIMYHERNHLLAQNVIAHLNSNVHSKSQKSVNALKCLTEVIRSDQAYQNFSLTHGKITCITCKNTLEPETNRLLEHMKLCSEARNQYLQQPQDINKPFGTGKPGSMRTDTNINKNHGATQKQIQNNPPANIPQKKKNEAKNKSGDNKKQNVKKLLGPLYKEFGNITYISQTDKGEVRCLICNCTIPPTTQNIKMHLTGDPHKKKVETQLKELTSIATNQEFGGKQSFDNIIANIFSSLPPVFQGDKVFIMESPIEGYVSCSLCECVINPYYLRNHLQEKSHISKKQGQRGC